MENLYNETMLRRRLYLFILTIFYYLPVYAREGLKSHRGHARGIMPTKKAGNIGDVASELFGFTQNIGQLLKVIAIVAGVALLFFSIVQYKKHRNNPIETPLSTVIMTFVIGLGLIALSFVPMGS